MTGPEHYQEAERLTSEVTVRNAKNGAMVMALFAEAQVHATLALAAATALTIGHEEDVADTLHAWHEVAGEAQR